ncbi:unnamed protein product, partial [Ectocarpus sp. 12 AP-2014]
RGRKKGGGGKNLVFFLKGFFCGTQRHQITTGENTHTDGPSYKYTRRGDWDSWARDIGVLRRLCLYLVDGADGWPTEVAVRRGRRLSLSRAFPCFARVLRLCVCPESAFARLSRHGPEACARHH